MLIPGNEIEPPSGYGRSVDRERGINNQRSAYLRNLTKPAANLSWKVLASRNMTCPCQGQKGISVNDLQEKGKRKEAHRSPRRP